MALLLASIFELKGGNRKTLNGSLGALLLLRILHVEVGLLGPQFSLDWKTHRIFRHAGVCRRYGRVRGVSGQELLGLLKNWMCENLSSSRAGAFIEEARTLIAELKQEQAVRWKP
jgi:hypothetical protein